jgi:alpha-tubulin suppressor-like RCC1 family protein
MKTASFTSRMAATLLTLVLLLPGWTEVWGQNQQGHSITLCENGAMRAFGHNNVCQLGLNSISPSAFLTPQPVPLINNVVAVSTGKLHSLALLNDGTVLAWGDNGGGCLGQASPGTNYLCTPTIVDSIPGCVVAVAAGEAFSLALLADSTIWGWGFDNLGQLGNGTGVSTSHIPVQVSGITTAIAIGAGFEHATALLADGTVWAWGTGSNGELGNGLATSSFAPVQVLTATATPLTNVVRIVAGGNHNVVLKSDNTVWTWGLNFSGQLGKGSYAQGNFAASATGLSTGTIIDIAAGDGFSMVLKSASTTRVTGQNALKQLGLSSPSITNTFIAGPTISGAIDISIGSMSTNGFAVTSSGQLYAWGNNFFGQVGNGTTTNVSTPVLINASDCPTKPSSDNHPQPCCVAVLEDERTVLQGDTTFTTSQSYTNLDMAVFNTITLNGGTHTFTTCDVVFGKDAKIIVNSGAKLYVESSSHFYACGDMWDGIIVNNGGRVYVRTSSIIEDAEIAVDIQYGALYTLNNATFNRNFIHVRKTMPLSGSPTNTGDYRIVKCKFKCQDYHGTGGVYSNLLPPRQADTTAIAIQAIGVPKLLVGNTSANANTFSNSGWGIWAQTVPRVEVLFNTFKDMILVGTHVSDGAGLGGETIRVAKNTMLRMPYGIYCYDNPKAEIKIDSNTVNFAGMTMPPSVMTGIAVEEITPGNSSFPNKVRIFDNDVFNAPSGIRVANLFGNALTPTTYIGENTVTHTKDVTYTDGAGILMQNVTGAVVKGNNVSGAAGINWWEHGIRSDGTTNLFLCDTVQNVGNGFTFDGDNRPSTLLALNRMDQNNTGIFLNWGIHGHDGRSCRHAETYATAHR